MGNHFRFRGLRNLVVCVMLAGLAWLSSPTLAATNVPSPLKLSLSQADQAWLAAHPVIRLGIDPGYGPYSFLGAQGNLQGVVGDFLAVLEPALGVRFEIISNLDWPQLMAAVKAHRIDAVATVVQLPERDVFLNFTAVYLPTPLVVMTRADTPQLHSIQDLSSLSLTLVKGYSSSKQQLAQFPDLHPHYVDKPLDGLIAVATGATDAYVGVLGVNSFLAAQHGIANLKVNAGFDMKVNGQRFGVRKDWPQLATLLDQALAAMPAQQKNAFFQKWMPLDAREIQRLSQPTLINRLFPWMLGLMGISLLGYLVVLIWNRQLKRELARRQDELMASTERLRAAETIAHVGNWQYKVADGVIQWSDEIYRIFGVEPQSQVITYEWIIAQVHPDDRAAHDAYLQRMLDSHPGQTFPELRYRLLIADGEVRFVNVLVRIEFDDAGHPLTLFGTLQDITEQSRAHERLVALNRLYNVLIGINEAIVRFRDPQTLFAEACRIAVEVGDFRKAWVGEINADSLELRPLAQAGVVDHYLENLHISLGENSHLNGPTCTALLTGKHRVSNDIANDPHMAPWRDAALALGYRSSAAFPIRVGGQVRSAFNLYASLPGAFDEVELQLLDKLADDIGFALEFIETDHARKSLNRRFLDMLESMSDGFVSLDRTWCYTYINAKAGELFGHTPAELLGKHIWTEFPEGVDQPFHTAYEQAMAGDKTICLEDYYAPWDQWYENHIYPTQDGISIFFTDITERKKREAELKRLHSILDALVEGSTDAIFVKNREGRYIIVNQAMADLLGQPVEAVLGMEDSALFKAETAQRFRADDQRIMASGKTQTFEEHATTPNATYSYLTTKGALVIDGEVQGVFGIARDFTERKRTEVSLVESESRLRLFIEHAPAALAMFDHEMRYMVVSRRWLTDYGLEHSDIIGQSHYAVFPEIPEHWKAIHQRGLNGELVRRDEDAFERADGTTQWLRWEVRPWFAADSEVGGIVIFSEDITKHKAAIQALQDSEARYRSLLEMAPFPAVFSSVKDGKLLYGNHRAERLFGLQREQGIGLPASTFYRDASLRDQLIAQLQTNGKIEDLEVRMQTVDGHPFWALVSASIVEFEHEPAIFAAINDITARKQMETDIRQLNTDLEDRVRQRTAELAAANKELETFTYSVSHDLKSPLRGIDGMSQILIEDYQDKLDAPGVELLNRVRNRVHQMNHLIEDLLGFSRMERRSLLRKPVDLSQRVNAVLDATREDIQARGMVVNVSLQGLTAQADPEGLTIVLRNLVDNAIKFTRDSQPPTLSITGRSDEKSITLIVKDNGIGFDMKYHDRIFEIFQQLQRADDYPGTGVGLAIVSKAMQRMGGRIWAESDPGQGATFYLELPR